MNEKELCLETHELENKYSELQSKHIDLIKKNIEEQRNFDQRFCDLFDAKKIEIDKLKKDLHESSEANIKYIKEILELRSVLGNIYENPELMEVKK